MIAAKLGALIIALTHQPLLQLAIASWISQKVTANAMNGRSEEETTAATNFALMNVPSTVNVSMEPANAKINITEKIVAFSSFQF
jgi:hypothetical protein